VIGGQRLGPRPAPARNPVLPPFVIKRSTRCINCGTCVQACLYECHERSPVEARKMADPKTGGCRNCFACILSCPRGALSAHPNEEYLAQGDGTYTPAIIRSIQEQAAEGKIPVSGAGYGGPFAGAGYDGIWLDMSEIVRPTRDGIHGREHISTTVSLGRGVTDLCGLRFDPQGNLKSLIPINREIPIPVILGPPPFPLDAGPMTALALSASKLNTHFIVRAEDEPQRFIEHFNHLIVRLKPSEIESYRRVLEWATMIELDPDGDQLGAISRAREINPHLLTIIRVDVKPGAEEEILGLAKSGAEILHLSADAGGRGARGRTLLECLRRSHSRLVEEGIRDAVTLVASGGIAAAEHVPKTIVLGADAVVVDVPLVIAMECTVCGRCLELKPCPRRIDDLNPKWGASRVINLMVSWRDQLLEVLGAMGLRDVRRLRGEMGRAMLADEMRGDFLTRLAGKTAPPGDEPTRSTAADGRAPAIRPGSAADRFRTNVARHKVVVDRAKCTDCGLCASTCRLHVHRRTEGRLHLDEPIHDRCLGPDCLGNDWCCVKVCPWGAISLEENSTGLALGDRRWTAELILETWRQARTGEPRADGRSPRAGASGGGFDALLLKDLPAKELPDIDSIDLSLPLNRRSSGPKITLSLPIYGGGMSYGSVSVETMVGRAMAARELGTLTSTGEGGYPDALIPYADRIITQIATGLFGVREETIMRARLVEFKYAQGAKPGLGGHLLGDKNTPTVAQMREAVPWTALFSPFPFHSVYSVEDHKKHVDWVRSIQPDLLVSVKVSTPVDVDMVAVGSYYAGANIIHLDGGYGGTGAAPDIAKKNIAQPIEYATVQVHDFLAKEGIRDKVVLMVGGGVRTAEDALKAVALGADGVVIGTAELVAVGCVRCGNCERNRGCPNGIATTDPGLSSQLTAEWVRDRIVNMYSSWAKFMRRRLGDLGLRSIRELRGRRDLLEYLADGSPAGDREAGVP
jgi:glutamate synthase domain-containing protein 2/Na+-translocating ferredoxin:NAD+ oxidoreductase RNF subunit RnfB